VTAETIEPTQLKSLRSDDFLDFFNDFADVTRNAARTIAREYHSMYRDARRLGISHSAAVRLAQLLMEWAKRSPSDNHEIRFSMALTHKELANMSSISRETVTRLLIQFEQDGLIHRQGLNLTILDPTRLAQFNP
jgi:CRP/FNR family transcriptional regulator, cyclic AMP receptor protein